MASFFFTFLALATTCLAANIRQSEVRFDVEISSRLGDKPQIAVHFANGVSDYLVLESYRMNDAPELDRSCSFIGHLENHPSSAAVTGCLDKPGDMLEITLLSEHNPTDSMFRVDLEGNLEVLEHPLNKGQSMAVFPSTRGGFSEVRRRRRFELVDGDEEVDNSVEAAVEKLEAAANGEVAYPSKMGIKVQFGTEDSFLKSFEDESAAVEWLNSVMTHMQAIFKHPSLQTELIFTVKEGLLSASGNTWTAENDIVTAAEYTDQELNDDTVDLVAWWCQDPVYFGVIGIAYVGTTCVDAYKTSLNEKRNTFAESASLLAHEMGHNLGMSHDFADKHEGKNCTGVMDYGDVPDTWSTCSVEDFSGYYVQRNWGEDCLDDLSGDDNGTTSGTTEGTTPQSTTSEGPESTTSEGPESTTSEGPESTTSEGPESTTSEGPESTTSEGPGSTTSEGPESTTSEGPDSTTSEGPESTTSEGPESTTSGGPESTTSEGPEGTTETPCKDEWRTRKCERKQKKNKCHKTKVMENCQKTCGYCGGTTSDGPEGTTEGPCEDEWSPGKCERKQEKNKCHKKRVKENCQKTCGYCS